jgi:hypothetical protein
MNYKWWHQGLRGGIYQTHRSPDGRYVRATFREARTALAAHFDEMAARNRDAAAAVRALRKNQLTDGNVQTGAL